LTDLWNVKRDGDGDKEGTVTGYCDNEDSWRFNGVLNAIVDREKTLDGICFCFLNVLTLFRFCF
jgi:hypothetical protein